MTEKGFYFDPKKWLGDSKVMAMDWDCKAMHLHLMALAWQQEKRGYLLKDEGIIRKLLGNPDLKDWETRIKSQIFSAWKEEEISNTLYMYQSGLLKSLTPDSLTTVEKPKKEKVVRVKKSKKIIIESDNEGFSLSSILKINPSLTILHEIATQEDKSSIWTLGLALVKKQGQSDAQARGFLAKLIKLYGNKAVANAIAQLSLKEISPVEVQSYLIGILKKSQEQQQVQSGRGSVSL